MLMCPFGWTHVPTVGSLLSALHAYNFVVIDDDGALHDEFDAFKKAEVDWEYCLLPMTELLQFWYKSGANGKMQPIVRFGRQYLSLHRSDVDRLVRWVLEMQDEYYRLGKVEVFHRRGEYLST